MNNDKADIFRKFLSDKRLQPTYISPEMIKVIEVEYVEKISAEESDLVELHSVLTISKLLCKCNGLDELDNDTYIEAQFLDDLRETRLQALAL